MSRAGRVCVVVHGPYPIDPRVAREVRVAVAEGYSVDVVATIRPGEPRFEVIDSVRIFRIPVSHESGRGFRHIVWEYGGFTLLASVLVARLSLKCRYDVVHINNPPDFLVVSALVPKLLGARVIFDIHDLAPDLFRMRFGGRSYANLLERALRLLERAAASVSDAVVTVHDPYRRELEARGIPGKKITVVLNSVDEAVLPPLAASAQNDVFRVVYHGTVTPHYGIELLVGAVAAILDRVPNVSLEIYGEGDALPAVRARAAATGIADSVRIHEGFLPLREVLERVADASVGVVANLPIERNNLVLPTKLLEYVALCVPVVACDLPTIREHFTDAEVRFFRAGDAGDLAAALVDVATDPRAANTRAEAALIRYAAYRWDIYAQRYASLLNYLAS